jgi:hypothetical protein
VEEVEMYGLTWDQITLLVWVGMMPVIFFGFLFREFYTTDSIDGDHVVAMLLVSGLWPMVVLGYLGYWILKLLGNLIRQLPGSAYRKRLGR